MPRPAKVTMSVEKPPTQLTFHESGAHGKRGVYVRKLAEALQSGAPAPILWRKTK